MVHPGSLRGTTHHRRYNHHLSATPIPGYCNCDNRFFLRERRRGRKVTAITSAEAVCAASGQKSHAAAPAPFPSTAACQTTGDRGYWRKEMRMTLGEAQHFFR